MPEVKEVKTNLPARLNRKGRRTVRFGSASIMRHANNQKGRPKYQANPLDRFLAQRNAEAFEWLFSIPEIHALAEGD